MQIDAQFASPFPSLSESLPSQTFHQPLQPTVATDGSDSPTPLIPDLPKNAYGLESFADYCAAVKRVKAGLPPIEAVTPPDHNKPITIHGINFKYWNPDGPESDISDTDSEITASQPVDDLVGNVKSTWSAGTPRKSILRQSTSTPLERESEVPLPDEAQNQLVFDYASSASPSSRRTSRLSSRRVSIDAGVQSEPVEIQNIEEEVVRTAAAKRLSARRSSIVPVRRSSVVHGLAGFTGVGRADSGAVICVSNGRKFELIVDTYEKDGGNEIAVQCSGLEIDSEIEALFGENCNEVIDVDAEPEIAETGKTGDDTATENCGKGGDMTMKTDDRTGEEWNQVPSPEQLRSSSVAFLTPKVSIIPNLEELSATAPKESDENSPAMIIPTHLSLRSDVQDMTRAETGRDEIVATSAHAGHKRLIHGETLTPKVRVSAPPRIFTSAGNMPESQEEAKSPETAPPAVTFAEEPQRMPVHAIADPTTTPSESVALDIVRQRSLSHKPADVEPSTTLSDPLQAIQARTLQLGVIRGVDVCPTASAYQLAAMATLSPRSYLRAVQPSQPRVVFAFASPGGTGPVGGVNIAPPTLVSTPPVATLAVAPHSAVRASLAAAPRRSHVSMPRTELSTPRHDLRLINGVQQMPKSTNITGQVDLEGEALLTPAPLQSTAQNSESEAVVSRRTGSSLRAKEMNAGHTRIASVANKASSSAVRSQDAAEYQADFVDDGDDDFDALPEMDDDPMEVEVEVQSKPEIQLECESDPKDEIKPQSVKSRRRKASIASSRSRASRKTQQSSGSERRRVSSVTQVVYGTSGESSDGDFSVENVEEEPKIDDLDGEGEEEESSKKRPSRKAKSTKQAKKDGQKTSKRRGQKRWRELKSLPTHQVNLNENEEEGGLRRSKRQRFPRLKFWRNETVSYERRLSQAIPTIAEVIVEVGGGSESDDDTWFGRR